MATKDLGSKHTCFKCATKFYDLKKPAPLCPKCGADQRDVPVQTRAERRKAAAARPEAEEPEETLLEDTEEEDAAEEEDEEDEERE